MQFAVDVNLSYHGMLSAIELRRCRGSMNGFLARGYKTRRLSLLWLLLHWLMTRPCPPFCTVAFFNRYILLSAVLMMWGCHARRFARSSRATGAGALAPVAGRPASTASPALGASCRYTCSTFVTLQQQSSFLR